MNDNWIGAPLREPKPEPATLYLSGPMSGYDDSNYPAFNEAAELLRRMGYTVLNPAEDNHPDHQYADLLALDIADVLKCEGVAVLEGWWASVGARLEVNIAGTLGRPVRPVGEWAYRKAIDGSAA